MTKRTTPTEQPNIDWTNLVQAVNHNGCILVIGPGAAQLERDGKMVSLQTLLAGHLESNIKKWEPNIQLTSGQNIPYLAKTLEDLIFIHTLPNKLNYTRENSRKELRSIISEFYKQYSFADFEVYTQIAKLPFHFLVETSPAPYLAQALENENKFDAKCFYYHYANPAHNNSIKIQESEIRFDAPLVYHLFGSVEQPDSMVLTGQEQLYFLDSILQQENTASIPNCIAIHFTSVKNPEIEMGYEKTFVFIGFDFNEWHLRIIIHLINRYQRRNETYALQNPEDIAELTSFFYRNNFGVRFVETSSNSFLSTFESVLKNTVPQPKSPINAKLNLFLMYAPDDESSKNSLDVHLMPLKKINLIDIWDESQMFVGDKAAEINKRLSEADIILLLISANFFVHDEIYNQQLQLALERHESKQAVVIPILISSCTWKLSPLNNLTTILPRNKVAFDKQDNPNTAMADTISQLERWCRKIYERKNTPK